MRKKQSVATLSVVSLFALSAVSAVAQETDSQEITQRGGAITIKVPDFATARDLVREAAKKQGGSIVDSAVQVGEKGRKHGWVRVSVPSEAYGAFLIEARSFGKVYGEKLKTISLTSRHAELEKRADKLREHQARLDGILGDKRRLRGGDLLFIQERLFRAGVDEEMLRQQRTDISRNAKHSTLVVAFFEPTRMNNSGGFKGELIARFQAGVRETLTNLVTSLVDSLAGLLLKLVIWIPVGMAAFVLWRRYREQIRVQVRERVMPHLSTSWIWLHTWFNAKKKRLPLPVPDALSTQITLPVNRPDGL